MVAAHNLHDLAALASEFVVKQRGIWEHEQWELLCARVAALGIELDDDLCERLGALLETLRVFYFCIPARPKRKTKAKAKTRTKAKTKARARTTSGQTVNKEEEATS